MPRTKGGSKVPNVKLRPAKSQKKPTERRLLTPGSSAADDPGSSPFGQRALLEGSKPLRRAHISSTGIPEKKDSFTKAKRMGADASSSLMTFSTHLLALEPDYDNEKYKASLSHGFWFQRNQSAAWRAGMHIVKPSWINEIYERWRLDETVDVMKSMELHYIGPFTDLCLSLTGPTDPVVRESFRRAVLQGGGMSMRSLEFGCTHLVCSTGDSEKIRWVQRLDSKPRDSNRLPPIMVWEEWLWDSFAAGRRLDESQYLLSKPRPTRKYRDVVKQPWPLNEEIGTQVPTALIQAPLTAPIPVAQLTDELEMPAIAKRVRNAGRKEWDRIIQRRALPGLSQDAAVNSVNTPYTPPKKASRRTATPLRGQGSLSPNTVNASPGWHKRSPLKQKQVLTAAQPTNGLSFPDSSSPQKISATRLPAENEAVAPAKPEAVTGKRTEKPQPPTFLGRIDRTNAFAKHGPVPTPKYQVQKNEDPDGLTSAIFAGKRVRTIGEASCVALRQEMERAGAALIDRTGAEVDFYVVRLAGGAELMKKEVSTEERHKVRTECWLERCLFESRICDVDENVTFRPLGVPTPLADTSQLFVASSGLDLSEQTWVKRLLRVLGMNWSQAFSKKCTHLICPSKQGPKYDKAREWEILIVDLGWLRDIAISGRIPPLHPASFADKTIASTDRPSQSQVLSISSVDSSRVPGKSVSMDVHLSQGTSLFAPSLPSYSACNLPIKSAAVFGDPAAFLLPLFGTSSPNKDGPQGTQSPASPSPPRRNLTTANAPLPLSKDRVPSSVSPEALKFPQLQPEGLDPKRMKGLAGDIGTLLLGSKRRAEDDGNEGDFLASIESVSGGGSRKRPRRPISRAKTVSDATATPPRMQAQAFFASTNETEDSQAPFDDTTACGVHYDDPSSRAEKKRLMSLLNGEDESQVASATTVPRPAATSVKKAAASKKTSRRKTRTSGF